MENKETKKSSTKIFAEVTSQRVQFWVSAIQSRTTGKLGLVATNLPVEEKWFDSEGVEVEEGSEGAIKSWALRPTENPEHIGIGLNAVRNFADQKGYDIVALKVTYEPLTKKAPRVLLHSVTATQKGDRWVFDLERSKCYLGGFPEGTMIGIAVRDVLAAAIGAPEEFVGEEASLTKKQKTPKKESSKKVIQRELNSLGAAFDAANVE